MIQLDEQLFLWLNNLGSANWDWFWLFMTNKFNMIPLYIVLLIVSFRHLAWQKGFLFLVVIALLITGTDQVTNLFKDGFERLRPCHNEDIAPLMRLVKKSCGGAYSFFSGHASNSFALATFFTVFFRKQFPAMKWLFFWAAVVAYSRVYVGVHFPLDIFCGAVYGIMIGWIIARMSFRVLEP
jgi:undecaprenyl-diphosphatase